MNHSDYLINPIRHLQRIKKHQYKREILPISTVALGILLQFWLRSISILFYPLLIICLAGVIWYLWVMAIHRTQNKIAKPAPDTIVSPLEGRIGFIRENQDTCLINIKKSWLDVIEIRCPHEACVFEDQQLRLSIPEGNIIFRFNSEHLLWLDNSAWEAGCMIGAMTGQGSCTISLPNSYKLEIKEGQLVFSGLSIISNTNQSIKKRTSILAEDQANINTESNL